MFLLRIYVIVMCAVIIEHNITFGGVIRKSANKGSNELEHMNWTGRSDSSKDTKSLTTLLFRPHSKAAELLKENKSDIDGRETTTSNEQTQHHIIKRMLNDTYLEKFDRQR